MRKRKINIYLYVVIYWFWGFEIYQYFIWEKGRKGKREVNVYIMLGHDMRAQLKLGKKKKKVFIFFFSHVSTPSPLPSNFLSLVSFPFVLSRRSRSGLLVTIAQLNPRSRCLFRSANQCQQLQLVFAAAQLDPRSRATTISFTNPRLAIRLHHLVPFAASRSLPSPPLMERYYCHISSWVRFWFFFFWFS